MTHLNIQQGSNAEIVSALIIKKLYDTALTVSEPLEGETDAAYMSGNLLANKASRKACTYLTTRFPNLYIAALDYYIDFEDPAVELLLIIKGVSSDSAGVTESDAANATLSNVFYTGMNVYNRDVTKFNEFTKFTLVKTNIPNNLFRNCSNLEEINLSDTITIGESSFRSSGIKDINIPTLQSLSSNAFNGSKVETITSLGTIYEIPDYAFCRCTNLTSAVLPTTLISIGAGAFSMLNTSETKVFTTISGLENVTNFGKECFTSNYNLQIQASDLSKAQTIGDLAFSEVNVAGLLYMKDLISLGSNAFYKDRYITKVLCLGKINTIPNLAFGNTTNSANLTEVYLPYDCTSIGNNAFTRNTRLTTIKQYVDSVDNWVEGQTPQYTNISRITSFGNECFNGCTSLSLTNADITNAISIGSNAFGGTTFTGDIYLPNITSLGNAAFAYSLITSIDLTGSTITSINKETFKNCKNLSKITLPSTVTNLLDDWAYGIPDILTIKGLNNVSSSSSNNFLLYNKIIFNPIKTSLVLGRNLFAIYQNNKSSNICLYYEPLRTITRVGYRNNAYNFYSLFVNGVSGGTGRMSIGLLYYRDITSFGNLTFFRCNIDNLVINNVTPPTLTPNPDDSSQSYYSIWGDKIFPTGNSDAVNNVVIGTLWVPDSAVATYLADPLYSHLNIKGIGTKTNGVDYDLPRYATYSAWEVAEEAAVAQGGHAVIGIIEEYM